MYDDGYPLNVREKGGEEKTLITVLAGGTGSAKFIRGLTKLVRQEDITVIANVGDNIRLFGLYICPDVDTVTYMFAGLLNRDRGWGIAGDTFRFIETLGRLGLETWFKLGDLDMATHVYRSIQMQGGVRLSEVTENLAKRLGVKARILPATDDWVETRIQTDKGPMHFQEFWVKRKAKDRVIKVVYGGVEHSKPAPGVMEAISEAEAVLLSPANPVTSIMPIVSIPGIKDALEEVKSKVLAVSPIIGKRAVSGPAGKLLKDLGFKVSAYTVAKIYGDFLSILLVDFKDAKLRAKIEKLGIKCFPTNILMENPRGEERLAGNALKSLGVKGKRLSTCL